MYDSVCEITSSAVPAAIKADFQKVESENSLLLHKVYVEKSKFIDSDSSSSRSDSDSVFSFAPALAPAAQSQVVNKLCEQVVLGRLASAEPDIFSGDPLEYAEWFNSFKALDTCRGVPETETIYYLKKVFVGSCFTLCQGCTWSRYACCL